MVIVKDNPGNFQDHPRKQIIRKKWAKSLLELTTKKLKSKFVYLGLPGIKALDVLEWLEHIEKVVAFQCNQYGGKELDDGSDDINELLTLLNKLETQEKIKSFQLYRGYIEDVVIRGIDDAGAFYTQNDFITVYNLDFCNTLTSPRKLADEKGKVLEYYKLDVIKRLLEFQDKITSPPKNKFIMFLTVNSNFIEENIDSIKNSSIVNYKKMISKISKPAARQIRLLKAYTYHHISEHFNKNNFNVEFLPPIFYQGSAYPNVDKGGKMENHMMLTFTILG